MKDATIPVAICLVGLVCIGLWFVTAGPVHLFSPPPESVQKVDDPPVVVTPAKKIEAPRKKFSAPDPAPAIVEEAAVVAPLPAPAPVVAQPPVAAKPIEPAQFPAASQIVIGTEKTALTKTFGEPTLSATSMDRGHLDETLVYARENGRRVTMINLEDGKTRSAH